MPMRQLRTCEFCGDDAAGVYEVFPPELSPTEAEQRRLVLCSDCAGTLETVVDPLLDRLGADTGDGASTADTDDEPGGRSVGADVSVADERGPDSDSRGSPTAGPEADSPRSPTADPDSDRPRSPTADPDSDDGPDDGPVQWGDSSTTADDGSVEPEHPPSDTVRNGVPGAGPSGDDSTGTGTVEPAAGDVDGADSGESGGDSTDGDGTDATGSTSTAGATGGDDATTGDEPEDFRTVMRLLGNREFPVERADIVELATNAYELDGQHVHRIIDHAVDRGVIADDGGTLRRN